MKSEPVSMDVDSDTITEKMEPDFLPDEKDQMRDAITLRQKLLGFNPKYIQCFEFEDRICFESTIRRIYEELMKRSYLSESSKRRFKDLRYPDTITFSDKNVDAEQILEILRRYQSMLTPLEIYTNKRGYPERLEHLIATVTRKHVNWVVPLDKDIDFYGDERSYKSYLTRRKNRISVQTKNKKKFEKEIKEGVTHSGNPNDFSFE